MSTKGVVLARPVEASGVPAPAGQELKGLQVHRYGPTPGLNALSCLPNAWDVNKQRGSSNIKDK